jgi:hypothetical protein
MTPGFLAMDEPNSRLRFELASTKASNRRKDWIEMERLEEFAKEFFALRAKPLPSAFDAGSDPLKEPPSGAGAASD